jgi:ribosomal RNA-processing protein 36
LRAAGHNSEEDEGGDDVEEDDEYSEDDDESDDESDDSHPETNSGKISVNPAVKEKLGKLGSLLQANANAEDNSSSGEEEGSDSEASEESVHDKNMAETGDDEEDSDSDSEADNQQLVNSGQTKKRKQVDDTVSNSKKLKTSAKSAGGHQKQPAASTEGDEEAARLKFRESLSKMSVEQIFALKNSLGLKLFNEKWNGKSRGDAQKQQNFKRENKNRPREMSSKKKVPKFKPVVQVGIFLS